MMRINEKVKSSLVRYHTPLEECQIWEFLTGLNQAGGSQCCDLIFEGPRVTRYSITDKGARRNFTTSGTWGNILRLI